MKYLLLIPCYSRLGYFDAHALQNLTNENITNQAKQHLASGKRLWLDNKSKPEKKENIWVRVSRRVHWFNN
jgi:hypothetical protein